MAFDTGSAVSGASQGFAVAGPWGALAGGVIGGVMGGKAKKKAKKKSKMSKAYMAESLKQIKLQNQINEQNWKFYQENVYPMELEDAKAMQTGAEQGAPEPLSRRYRDRAAADVMQSFQKHRAMTQRENLKSGIDPSSGRSQALEQQGAVAEGASKAGEITRAGERASEDWRERRNVFMDQHSGKSDQVYGRRGDQAQTASNLAGMYQAQAGDELQKGREQTQAFMGAVGPAKQMIGSMGNSGPSATQSVSTQQYAEGGPAVGQSIAGGNDMMSAEGGAINGPGGPVDDQVPADLPEGSYVIPADVVSAVGVDFFDKLESDNAEGGAEGMQDRVNAMTSDGEYVISPNVVQRKGKKFFDDLLVKYHKPAAQQSKQYQNKTAKTNDAGGAKQKFQNAPGDDGTPQVKKLAQGGYLSANVTEQPKTPVDPGQQSFQYGGSGTSVGYDKPAGSFDYLGGAGVNQQHIERLNQTPGARKQMAGALAQNDPTKIAYEANPNAAVQGDIGTGAGQGDRISQWSARRAHIQGQNRYQQDVIKANEVKAGQLYGKPQVRQEHADGGKVKGGRRERFSKGVRKDGGYTGGEDKYKGGPRSGTGGFGGHKDGKVAIQAGVGEGNMGGGGARAYHDGDQVGRSGGKSLKDGGKYKDGKGAYAANRTSLGVAEKPKGVSYKDGGPPKSKTRRGGKKHKPPVSMADVKRWAPKNVFQKKADGGVQYWEPGMPGRPKPGMKGPPKKPIRGDYSGTGEAKPKATKTRVYKGEGGSKPYGEE